MCLLYFLQKYIEDRNKLLKIFPVLKRKCCVCMDVKTNIIRCTNLKCSDGIVCHECFKKLDDRMKEKCLVCMTKRITKHKEKKNFCDELIIISLSFIISIVLGYIIGLLLFSLFTNKYFKELVKNTNPVFLIIFGFTISGMIIIFCLFCYFFKTICRDN